MLDRNTVLAWFKELKEASLSEAVTIINEKYEYLQNLLPDPPQEVVIEEPVVVEEAPTIEEHIAPKVGDKIVIDDPRYNYYRTEIPSDQLAFLLTLSDALSKIESIEHESMILNDGSENYVEFYQFSLPPKEGCDKPHRVHNKIVMDVYNNENEDIDPVLLRSCTFYLNQLPEKIQNTFKKMGIFQYDKKTGYPITQYMTI